jgi:hypothetical protein
MIDITTTDFRLSVDENGCKAKIKFLGIIVS